MYPGWVGKFHHTGTLQMVSVWYGTGTIGREVGHVSTVTVSVTFCPSYMWVVLIQKENIKVFPYSKNRQRYYLGNSTCLRQ